MPFKITGIILNAGKTPASNVFLDLTQRHTRITSVQTNDKGVFTMSKIDAGSYTVIPVPDDQFAYDPEEKDITVVDKDVPNVDFTCITLQAYDSSKKPATIIAGTRDILTAILQVLPAWANADKDAAITRAKVRMAIETALPESKALLQDLDEEAIREIEKEMESFRVACSVCWARFNSNNPGNPYYHNQDALNACLSNCS